MGIRDLFTSDSCRQNTMVEVGWQNHRRWTKEPTVETKLHHGLTLIWDNDFHSRNKWQCACSFSVSWKPFLTSVMEDSPPHTSQPPPPPASALTHLYAYSFHPLSHNRTIIEQLAAYSNILQLVPSQITHLFSTETTPFISSHGYK